MTNNELIYNIKLARKPKSLTAMFLSILLVTLPLSAQPTGANVVSGSATFNQSANNMSITTSNKAIINYNSFNIAQNEILRFIQPSANSVVLNRVILNNPSAILGSLNANGNVFLVNPAGVFFGAGSSVNANSFVATTLNISNEDFLNNNYSFNQMLDEQSRAIVQQGTITVSDRGFVVLSAPMVSNEGQIIAKAGNVVIGATNNFYIQLDAQGLIRYDYAQVQNIDQPIMISESHASNIMQNVLNTDAIKDAITITKDGDSIILGGAYATAFNSGTIDTSATKTSSAGTIEIKAGEKALILNNSKLISNAESVGNGGVIDIYANEFAYADKGASFEAKGGTTSGDGGFVELSAKKSVTFNGSKIDMTTVDGENGLFLIDPENLTISSNVNSGGANLLFEADDEIRVSDSVIISTRNIDGNDHLNDVSLGDSGDLTMESSKIVVGKDSKLLTFGNNGKSSGSINLTASSTESNPIFNTNSSETANILIEGATLKGGAITITSQAAAISNFASADADRLTDDENLEFFIDKIAPTISTPYAVAKSTAIASVTIGEGTNIEGDSITITSDANARSNTKSTFAGVTIGEGISIAKATTTINKGATLTSETDITIGSNADVYSKVDTLVQDGFAFSNIDVVSNSIATVEDGAIIIANGDLFLQAGNTKMMEASAASEALKGASAALATTDSTSITQAILGGKVNANNINVEATTTNKVIETVTNAKVGDPALFDRVLEKVHKGASELKISIEKFIKKWTTLIKFPKIGLSGGISLSEHTSTTIANIADNANIVSNNALNINALSVYPIDTDEAKGIKTSAMASVISNKFKPINFGVAAAVAETIITNNVSAFIGKDASVDSGGDIVVSAKTEMPYQSLWGEVNHIQDAQDHLNANFGVQDKVFTTWAQSSGQGDNVGIAGSVNIFELNNDTQAYIDVGVLINQNSVNPKNVLIEAQTDLKTLNLAGVFGLTIIGSGGGKGGLGVSYLDVSYNDITKATIKNAVKLNADALAVIAQSKTTNISASVAGGQAKELGISGSVSNLNITNTTYANIHAETINLQNGSNNKITGITDDNLLVYANDDAHLFNITGGIVKAKNVGIGASVSINNITRDTQAGMFSTILNGEGDSIIQAINSGVIDAFSLAGTVITKVTTSVEDADKGAGKYGVGISGDTSINNVNDTAKAIVKDTEFTNSTGNLEILAKNDSEIKSYSGSVALVLSAGKSAGIAGSYSQNSINNITQSSIDNSKINAKEISLKSINSGIINSYSASGAGAPAGAGIAGSVSINKIINTTTASILGNSQLNSQNNIEVLAKDNSEIKTIAGAVGFGGKAGIGASFAKNSIENTIEASVKDSELKAQNNLDIIATNDSKIDLIVASLGAALSTMAASVSVGISEITNSISAWISGKHLDGVDITNDVQVKAIDTSDIDAKAGQLSAAISVAVGASYLYNKILNTINAFINNSDVESNNNIEIHATSTKNISAISVGGSVSSSVSINGGVLINTIEDEVKSYISNSDVKTSGSISIKASQENDISVINGILSASLTAGIGGAVSVNTIKNNVSTYIQGSDIKADGKSSLKTTNSDKTQNEEDFRGVDILASTNQIINSKVANASAGKAAIGGSVSVNTIENRVNSYIDSSNVNVENTNAHTKQDVRVRAISINDVDAIAGGLAGGLAGGALGSSDTTTISNISNAYIKGGFIYAKELVAVESRNFNNVNNIVVSGAGAGVVALAGSVAVININSTNDAYAKSTIINSDNGINIIALDDTDVDVKAGALVGGGTAGFGGSVVVTDISQNVKARLDGSKVNAKGTLNVLSDTKADINSNVATGALGGYAGIAGAINTNKIDATSQAYTTGMSAMLINQDENYQSNLQAVNVKAKSDADIKNITGALGIGLAGAGASVDNSTINNTVLAKLGEGSKIYADKDIVVEASSDKFIESKIVAYGGGAVGIAGAVSNLNINKSLIENSIYAVVGDGAIVEAGKNIKINAKDRSKIDILAGSEGVGILGLGGSVGIANIGSNAKALIGKNSLINTQNLEILSDFVSKDNAINSFAAGAGAVGLGAAVSELSINYETEATVDSDSKIIASENIKIKAITEVSSSVIALGASGGAAAVGVVIAETNVKGSTYSSLKERSDVRAKNLNIEANYLGTHYTTSGAAAAGIASGLGSVSSVKSEPTVIAEVKDGVKINVIDKTIIKAQAIELIISTANGIAIGGIAVGVSQATSTWKPTIETKIGSNVVIDTDSLLVKSDLKSFDNEDHNVKAKAFSASGALIGGSGAIAKADIDSTVSTSIASSTSITTKSNQHNLDIKANSNTNAMSESDGHAYGVAAAGNTISTTNSDAKTNVTIGDDTSLVSEKDIVLEVYSKQQTSAIAKGGAGGLLAAGGTEANINMLNDVDIVVGERSSMIAKNGNIYILAKGAVIADATSSIKTIAGISENVSFSKITIDQDVNIKINSNSKLEAQNIKIEASVEQIHSIAKATSETISVDSKSIASSKSTVNSDVNLHIDDNVLLKAEKSAHITSNQVNTVTKSIALAKIDAGATGSLEAHARNDLKLTTDTIIDNGVEIHSNDIYIEAINPDTFTDKRQAETEAKTVVNYVLTAVEKVFKEVSKIPIIGWIVKKVTKIVMEWVRELLNSTENSKIYGETEFNSNIVMNGTMVQTAAPDQYLEISSDGTIIKNGDITAQIDGLNVVVNDLINSGKGKINLITRGTITGDAKLIVDNAYSDVTIKNNSNKNLIINKINTVSNNGDEANINIQAQINTLNLDIVAVTKERTLNIENLSDSDIYLNDKISNFAGNTNIYNQGGDILSNVNGLIKTKTLDIFSARGDIGSSAQRMEIELQKSDASNTKITSNSFGKSYLGLKASELIEAENLNNYTIDSADISDITANGPIDLVLHSGYVNRIDLAYNIHTELVASNYNISKIKSSDDITIDAKEGVFLNIVGVIESGVKDVVVSIDDTDPSITSSEYISSVTSEDVVLNPITHRGGEIRINTVDKPVSGMGTLTMLDGYTHVKVENQTDKNLNVNTIDTDEYNHGGLYVNSVFIPFGEYNNLAVNKTGYEKGSISVDNKGTGKTTMSGNILNKSGDITIAGNNAFYNPNNRLVSGGDVNFNFTSGDIGSKINPINIDGVLSATTPNDIYVNDDSDMLVAKIIAKNIHLNSAGTVTGTDSSNTKVKAKNLEITSLSNIGSDKALNIKADKIAAVSQNGFINVKNSTSTTIGSVGETTGLKAFGKVELETKGSLLQEKGADIISSTDDITLASQDTTLIDLVSSTKDVSLSSKTGSIIVYADDEVDIYANKLTLNANSGIGDDGTTRQALDTKIAILDATNKSNDILINNEGVLEIANVKNASGDVEISSTKDITVSQMRAKNILLVSKEGDILGNERIVPNISATKKLTLIAKNGVIGTPKHALSIKEGTEGIDVISNSSKNLISIYVKGLDAPIKGNTNLDLVVFDNRIVSGTRIKQYLKTQYTDTAVSVSSIKNSVPEHKEEEEK